MESGGGPGSLFRDELLGLVEFVSNHSDRLATSIRGEQPARSGNRKLKRALFLSAFAALHDTASRTYYDRKRAEGKKHNAALICFAGRRCDDLYAMLKNREPYRSPAVTAAWRKQ